MENFCGRVKNRESFSLDCFVVYGNSGSSDKGTGGSLFLEISVISALYIIKQPISSKGLHPPHPYSIFG